MDALLVNLTVSLAICPLISKQENNGFPVRVRILEHSEDAACLELIECASKAAKLHSYSYGKQLPAGASSDSLIIAVCHVKHGLCNEREVQLTAKSIPLSHVSIYSK